MANEHISKAMEHFAQGIALLAQAGMANAPTVSVNPAVLSTEEAATYIGVSRSRFYELLKAKKIKPVANSNPPVYRVKNLDAYLDRLERG